MIVRKAALKDRRAVLSLIRELQTFLDLRPTEVKASERLYASLLKEQNHHLLVAEEKGDILGLASLWFRKSLFHSGTCCLLDELIVQKDAQGKDVGRALVAEVVLTFMFLVIILGATDRRAPQGFAPIAIGLGLTLIHLIGIPVTNLSVNPARSTGPAIFVGGWALQQLWLFWVAPILGALIARVVYAGIFGAREEPVAPVID